MAADGADVLMRLAGAVAITLLLVGCGGTRSSLDGAAQATSAETSRLEMDWQVTGGPPEGNFAMKARGAFDFPNERAAMTISGEMPPFGEDVVFEEFRLIGKTGYTRWLIKGKAHWVQTDESDASGDPTDLLLPLPGTSTKPTDVLARVLSASDDTEELGHQEIRGVDTTHYRARVDVKRLAKQMPRKDRPEGDAGGAWGLQFIPVELWIDEESRLRRITTVEKEEDDPATMTMTVELYDYGVEVDVDAPEGKILTEDEFEKLEGSPFQLEAAEGEGGEEELTPEEMCRSAREELPKKDADEICESVKETQ